MHAARRGRRVRAAVAGREPLREVGVARAAARAREVGEAGRAVGAHAAVAVGRDRVDQGQRGDRPVERVGGDRRRRRSTSPPGAAAARSRARARARARRRPSRAGPRVASIGARLAVAEAAHVRGQEAIALRRTGQQVLVEAARWTGCRGRARPGSRPAGRTRRPACGSGRCRSCASGRRSAASWRRDLTSYGPSASLDDRKGRSSCWSSYATPRTGWPRSAWR